MKKEIDLENGKKTPKNIDSSLNLSKLVSS